MLCEFWIILGNHNPASQLSDWANFMFFYFLETSYGVHFTSIILIYKVPVLSVAIRPISVPFLIMRFKILHEIILDDCLNALRVRNYCGGFGDCYFMLSSIEQSSWYENLGGICDAVVITWLSGVKRRLGNIACHLYSSVNLTFSKSVATDQRGKELASKHVH